MRNLLPLLTCCSVFMLSGCQLRFWANVSSDDKNGGVGQIVNTRPMSLPSGKTVPVLEVRDAKFRIKGDPPALLVHYLSDVPITDVSALKKEATEVWSVFKKQVEASGKTVGAVRAQEKVPTNPNGMFKIHTFAWHKQKNGKWLPVPEQN